MGGIFKTVAKIAPVAAAFVPGLSPLALAGIGAASGVAGGGGLKGALLGGAGGYIGGGGTLAGKTLGGSLGLGSASTINSAVGGALSAAGTGSDPILGAIGGGLSANAGSIGESLFGSSASKPLAAGVQGASKPATTGLLGNLGTNTVSSGGSMFNNTKFSDLLGAGAQAYSQEDAASKLKKAQQQAMQQFQPYSASGLQAQQSLASRLAAGFKPQDLSSDAGYQFQLSEAQKAADKSQAARGNYYSGAALKEAQTQAQGLADTTYNDAYNRWLQENQQLAGQGNVGYNAAANIANSYNTLGDVGANQSLARSNLFNSALSNIMGNRQPYPVSDDGQGNIIYSDGSKRKIGSSYYG